MSFDARLLTGIGVLVTAAEAGSFAKAAEILGLTPSGVSRAIARLEARVGIRMFDRTSRRVNLTEEGRRFHSRVVPLLAGLEEASFEASGSAAAVSGRLRVNVDPWFARMVLAPHMPAFMKQYPQLLVDLTISNAREDMLAGVDVAVRFGPPDVSSAIARKLFDTYVITCAAPGYLAERGEPKVPTELYGHECILFKDPQGGRPFPWEFHRGSEVLQTIAKGRLIMDDPSVAVAACVAGQGIFQSLRIGLDPWLTSGQLRQILTEWSSERYPLYAYHPSRYLPPAKVRAFIDFIQQLCTASGPDD
ncbi:LysR family transcriptional regulator [Rhizobium sp. No.120]